MRVGPTLERLRQTYPDDLRIVYKMHPLANHPFAQRAAQAALAAQEQGKFMEMHELLPERYRSYNALAQTKAAALGLPPTQGRSTQVQDAIFVDFARDLGLNEERFRADFASEATRARITAETREVVAIGAGGTPASFINGRYLRGAAPFEKFQTLVDRAIGGVSAAGGGVGANP